MCGHFSINYLNLAELIERFSLGGFPDADPFFASAASKDCYPSRGNVSSYVPAIIRENDFRKLSVFRWDIVPGWWSKPLKEKKFASFNARSDSLNEKPVFKKAWKNRQRCLIPATAFYEWPDKKQISPGIKRMEYAISIKGTKIFSMAGIWDAAALPDSDTTLRSCAIITTDANEAIAKIPHTRMPVILKEEDEDEWLDVGTAPDSAFKMLHQYPEEKLIIQAGGIDNQLRMTYA